MITPPAALEALLFTAGEPLEKKQVAALLEISPEQLGQTVEALAGALSGRGLALIETETELELRTVAEAADIVKKLRESELSRDLGKGSLETLAVIAYQEGGATRADIDWVRGVNSSAALRTLLLRGLIRGEEDPEDKRRIRYTLTPEALAHLGLTSLEHLPNLAELRGKAREVLERKDQPDTAESDS